MSFIVDPGVEEYAEAHSSPEGDLFERLAAETHEKTTAPQMMVGRIEGRFLGVLVRSLRARRVLELGTFTGYSSIAMALALPSGGRVITCDVNEEPALRIASTIGSVPGSRRSHNSMVRSTSSLSTPTSRTTSTTTRRRCRSWQTTG